MFVCVFGICMARFRRLGMLLIRTFIAFSIVLTVITSAYLVIAAIYPPTRVSEGVPETFHSIGANIVFVRTLASCSRATRSRICTPSHY